MEDEKILALYHARDERAITQTKIKYGKYCRTIAYRILRDIEDAEECENDTYLHAWRAIPPHKPPVFSVFLGMIARRTAIDKLKKKMATRRGSGEALLSLSELDKFRILCNCLIYSLIRIDASMLLIHICKFYSLSDNDFTCIWSIKSHDQTEQSSLTSTVRSDYAHDTCWWKDEIEILVKELVTISL